MIHPRKDENGKPVKLHNPNTPTPLEAFEDPTQIAVVIPDGKTPAELNGIAFDSWNAPTSPDEWAKVSGQVAINEPPMVKIPGKKLSAGVVVLESDGRVWVAAPSNAFSGYKATFAKGRLDAGMSPQATAIKEAFEELGLQVEITGLVGDFERSTTVTRYYTARRIGGDPADMQWETQAVMLVPKSRLLEVLNHPNDHAILTTLGLASQ